MSTFDDLINKVMGDPPPPPPPTAQDTVAKFFLGAGIVIEYIGMIVLLLGIALSLFDIIKMLIQRKSFDLDELNTIAVRFVFFCFIGIGFLLVWQVIILIFHPTFSDALTMSEILGIEFVLGYFLRRGRKEDKVSST